MYKGITSSDDLRRLLRERGYPDDDAYPLVSWSKVELVDALIQSDLTRAGYESMMGVSQIYQEMIETEDDVEAVDDFETGEMIAANLEAQNNIIGEQYLEGPQAVACTRRQSVKFRHILPSAGALGGIFVTVTLVIHEGAYPIFKTTVTNGGGSTTVLNKRFGEFRRLFVKVCYLIASDTSICSKVF